MRRLFVGVNSWAVDKSGVGTYPTLRIDRIASLLIEDRSDLVIDDPDIEQGLWVQPVGETVVVLCRALDISPMA